jgi:hypothetical protein
MGWLIIYWVLAGLFFYSIPAPKHYRSELVIFIICLVFGGLIVPFGVVFGIVMMLWLLAFSGDF